jgi:hypothetical protein
MIANAKPTPNPKPENMNNRATPTLSSHQLLPSEEAAELGVSHCLDSGLPQRPTLPSNELLENEKNWLL